MILKQEKILKREMIDTYDSGEKGEQKTLIWNQLKLRYCKYEYDIWNHWIAYVVYYSAVYDVHYSVRRTLQCTPYITVYNVHCNAL